MGFSLLPKEDAYFTLFSDITGKIQEASTVLVRMVSEDDADLITYAKQIKDIEHSCDQITHDLTTKLNKSFITPIDREDIFTLAVALDDVCDYVDAAARAIRMYNISQFNEFVRQLARLINSQAAAMNSAVAMLKNPNGGMNAQIVEIHRLENEADDAYSRAIGDLFKNSVDPIEVIKLKELLEILENATDKGEQVANIIESIVLKHH
jgi:predicted phosphate transport protein (TIGR00153 family)